MKDKIVHIKFIFLKMFEDMENKFKMFQIPEQTFVNEL